MSFKALSWLRGFGPAQAAVVPVEWLRAGLGALFGIAVAGAVSRAVMGSTSDLPLLVAPVGASAVLLFGVPGGPLAQPWSLLAGNLISAVVGVACARWIPWPLWAAALAVGGAVGLMFALRCVHPPGGAVALTAVIGGPAIHALGFGFALVPVGINSLFLLGAALLFNNITRRRYPHVAAPQVHPHRTADLPASDRLRFQPEDLDRALARHRELLDISRDDLDALFLDAETHAYHRRFGQISCADIMSRDVISVEFGTPLQEAWALMERHRLQALPVVDRARRVIGMVTREDFLRQAGLSDIAGLGLLGLRLRALLAPVTALHTEQPQVAGQIMSTDAAPVAMERPIADLVPLLADRGIHHLPVVDGDQRLVGVVSQSDLIAALYRGGLNAGADQAAA